MQEGGLASCATDSSKVSTTLSVTLPQVAQTSPGPSSLTPGHSSPLHRWYDPSKFHPLHLPSIGERVFGLPRPHPASPPSLAASGHPYNSSAAQLSKQLPDKPFVFISTFK